jgi:predicted dehydrogenase
MSDIPIRIGFIGTGGVSRSHRAALSEIEGADLAAVYDLNREATEKVAEETGAAACRDVEDLIDRSDAVYILTPPHTHKDLTLQVLGAGRHVLCEKPLAISLEDGRAIVQAANDSSAHCMVAFSQRFRDSYRQMRDIYRSGRLGNAITFYYQRMFGGGDYNPDNWRYRSDSRCGMSIESLSHQIDLVRWSVDEIDTVYAKAIASFEELPDVDNNIHATFTLRNGCVATVHVSWSSFVSLNTTGINGTDGTLRINGSGGMNHDDMQVNCRDSAPETIVLNEPYGKDVFKEQSLHFVDCIRRGEAPQCTAADGLKALEVSHAILESSASGREVNIRKDE